MSKKSHFGTDDWGTERRRKLRDYAFDMYVEACVEYASDTSEEMDPFDNAKSWIFDKFPEPEWEYVSDGHDMEMTASWLNDTMWPDFADKEKQVEADKLFDEIMSYKGAEYDESRENHRVGVVILDSESTDPTWALQKDVYVVDVWSEDLALVQSGEMTLQHAVMKASM